VFAVEDRDVGGNGANALFECHELSGRALLATCDEDRIRTADAGDRLAQQPAGEHVAVAERLGGADQQKVVVAAGAAVLEAVVEDERVHVGPIAQDGCGAGDAIRVGVDRDAGPRAVRVEIAVEHELLVADRGALHAIAAHEDRRFALPGAELFGQPPHGRRLARAAGRQVADADRRPAQRVARARAAVVHRVAHGHDAGIERLDDAHDAAQRRCADAARFAAHDAYAELFECWIHPAA
jgi:hypothetical protein